MSVTKADIIRERDERQQSWKAVAEALGLANPGAARTAYTRLTGKHHTESVLEGKPGRVSKKKVASNGSAPAKRSRKKSGVLRGPKWHDDSSHEEIREAIINRRITVERSGAREEIRIRRVKGFITNKRGKNLAVEVTDDYNGAHRTFYVRDIVEVR